MTFDAQETSRESGEVIELYTFIFGLETFRFTSFQRDITWSGLAYTSTQISRGKTVSAIEDVSSQVTITTPIDNPVVQKFIATVPGTVGSVEILRAHLTDVAEETLVLFQGFVANVSLDGELEGKILCFPNTKIFNRTAPRFTYQSLCNHVLYDSRCKIARSAFLFTGIVSVVSGNDITVNGAGAVGAADHFVSGFASFPASSSEDSRAILAQSSDVLTLLLPFSIPILGDNIDLFAGCDHGLSICDTKFANTINYGGFPYVPRKNPFNTTLRGGS